LKITQRIEQEIEGEPPKLVRRTKLGRDPEECRTALDEEEKGRKHISAGPSLESEEKQAGLGELLKGLYCKDGNRKANGGILSCTYRGRL